MGKEKQTENSTFCKTSQQNSLTNKCFSASKISILKCSVPILGIRKLFCIKNWPTTSSKRLLALISCYIPHPSVQPSVMQLLPQLCSNHNYSTYKRERERALGPKQILHSHFFLFYLNVYIYRVDARDYFNEALYIGTIIQRLLWFAWVWWLSLLATAVVATWLAANSSYKIENCNNDDDDDQTDWQQANGWMKKERERKETCMSIFGEQQGQR